MHIKFIPAKIILLNNVQPLNVFIRIYQVCFILSMAFYLLNRTR